MIIIYLVFIFIGQTNIKQFTKKLFYYLSVCLFVLMYSYTIHPIAMELWKVVEYIYAKMSGILHPIH